MFSNPFFRGNGGPNLTENPNDVSSNSDQKDMIGDMTDQSLDVSGIEENNPAQKGFANPFHEKQENKVQTNEKTDIPKEDARAPELQNVREESQPRPSVKDLIKNFQPKKAEKQEEKTVQPPVEARSSVKNLISRFEKKPENQAETAPENNPIVIEGRNSVSSMIKNIEKKVTDNENKIFGSDSRQVGSDNNIAQENEGTGINPIQETNEKHEQSGLLDEYSQDFSDVNTSNNAGGGFRNPYKDVVTYGQKNGLMDQSQDKSQEMPRQTAQFGEAPTAPEQYQQHQFVAQADTSNIDQSESGILDDITENDESLNISGFKPMMNNPLGLNRSYLDNNKSQLDVSRSKLNYSNISQLDNKGQTMGGLQVNFDANFDYGQNMDLRVQEFDDHVLSQLTDNTQDLSHMTVPGFKNVFYGKDNSYYLNMTGLDQSIMDAVNRSQMQNKSMNKSMNKSHNKTGIKDKSQHLIKEELNKSGNILDELHGPADQAQVNLDPSHFQPRPTANFGIEALGHPEEAPEDMPRPTGQFGFVVQVQEATPQNMTAEGNKSRIQQDKSRLEEERDVSQNRSQLGVIDREQNVEQNKSQVHRPKEDSDDKIQEIAERDPFKLSQLDISKISVFDTTQDHEDFGPNVTVNNMRAFLSHSRFAAHEHEKRDSHGGSQGGEYDPDLTLELQQEINPEYRKPSLALDPEQPKISEVSVAREETQIMDESREKRQVEDKLSLSGQKNVSSEKEITPVSKSFNEKIGSSFIAQESKNKSFDSKQPVYNNYTNPFTAPRQEEDIYEMRLTVGNLPPAMVITPVEVEKQVTYTNPFTGLNKSYDAGITTSQDNAGYLNKSYQDISAGKSDTGNKITRDFHVSVQKSQGEANQEVKGDSNDELVKEGVELVDRMKNVYNDWKAKNEQFDGYLDEIKRFTFQKPVDQIKIDRSFDIASKTPKENDRLTHSFDAGGLRVPQGQQQDVTNLSSYYKQDLLADEKSFSDLNVSQDPASEYKKFTNPAFAKPSENISTHQIDTNALTSQDKANDRIFEGFTLGGSRKLVGDVSSEAQNANLLNKSLDFYLSESANARENLNKSYSAYAGKDFVSSDIASESKPAPAEVEAEKLNISQNNKTIEGTSESKTEGETPNFGNAQVSTSSLLEENQKALEGSHIEEIAATMEEHNFEREHEREPAERKVRAIQVPKEEVENIEPEKLEIKLPLIFKKQQRSRPQILVPKRTINVPAAGQIDFVVQKRENKKGSVNTYAGIELIDEKNPQRRFFGYKVKKDKFERERYQRKVNTEIENLDTTDESEHVAETVVSEDVKELNRKLEELRAQTEGLLNEIESDTNFSEDEDGQSTISSIKSVRPLQVGKTGSKRTSPEGGNKMKFYSIAVNYRIDLPQEHPGKNVSIADLYNECMEQNMPEKEWNEFLKRRICS